MLWDTDNGGARSTNGVTASAILCEATVTVWQGDHVKCRCQWRYAPRPCWASLQTRVRRMRKVQDQF